MWLQDNTRRPALHAVNSVMSRWRSPPASWIGAAVALAALRMGRPLVEPLTSGAESRRQYQTATPETPLGPTPLDMSSLPPGHVMFPLICVLFFYLIFYPVCLQHFVIQLIPSDE